MVNCRQRCEHDAAAAVVDRLSDGSGDNGVIGDVDVSKTGDHVSGAH